MYGFHFEGHNGNTDEKMFLHINEEKTDEVLSPKDEEKIGQSALATPIDSVRCHRSNKNSITE